MPCVRPLKIEPYGPGGYVTMVRCGKCDYCIKRHREAWIGRLCLERHDWANARFVTLTYENNPERLDKKHFQDFMKRYRYYYGECRYFAVGEYGEQKKRPHWHAIIYGHPPEAIGHWKENKAWTFGYSYDGAVAERSIRYVASYMRKAEDPDYPPVVLRSLRPGLGIPALTAMGQSLAGQQPNIEAWPYWYRINGHLFPIADSGLDHFKEAYLNAGGSPPAQTNPDELHELAIQALGDLGSRVKADRRWEIQFKRRRGYYGLPQKTR